jgi:hypothetical protein
MLFTPFIIYARAITAHNNLLGRMRAEFTHHLYILEKLSRKKTFKLPFIFLSFPQKKEGMRFQAATGKVIDKKEQVECHIKRTRFCFISYPETHKN